MTEAATKTAPARQKAREPVAEREPDREPARPGALTFKHPLTGEILTRDAVPTNDSQFDIPREIIPDGMVYQWRRETMLGEPDIANISALKRNGWREVPQERHPERPVRLEGLVLMECPVPFVEQARAEERAAAMAEKRKQLRPRNEAVRPGYFDDDVAARRGVNFGARRGAPEAVDPALRPTYARNVDIDG